MSGSENASDGSGNSSDNNSSNSGDCEEITSALATPTSSGGAAASTTPPTGLRNSMLPAKVDRMMFLRLNRMYIPEVKTLRNVIEGNKSAVACCREKVKSVEEATAGKDVVLAL